MILTGRSKRWQNEVRMLSGSIMNNGGALCTDKMIRYDPDKSVFMRRIGEQTRLNEEEFTRLSSAFLAEIEARYL